MIFASLLFVGLAGAVLQHNHENMFDATCNGGSVCSGNEFCCYNNYNNTGGVLCCSGDESCCPDPVNGAVCCERQQTFCCPPNGNFPQSHCCPHWQVCCTGGRYGCCDPGTLKTASINLYGMLYSALEPGNGLITMIIDADTGSYTYKPSPVFPTGDETPRTFAFDPQNLRFLIPTTNWSSIYDGQPRPVTLWSIDATSGATEFAVVPKVFGDVTGFTFVRAKNYLLVGVADLAQNDTVRTAYHFYSMTFAKGGVVTAKLLSSSVNKPNEDNYVGWFKTANSDGSLVYRLGYLHPTTEMIRGVGVTNITLSTATTVWHANIFPPNNNGWYQSITPIANNDFVSLAGPDGDADGDLTVVRWGVGKNATILANLGDAHRPPYFGPLSQAYANGLFASFAVELSYISEDFDRWILITVDVRTGDMNYLPLDPFTVGDTDSVCGLGFA